MANLQCSLPGEPPAPMGNMKHIRHPLTSKITVIAALILAMAWLLVAAHLGLRSASAAQPSKLLVASPVPEERAHVKVLESSADGLLFILEIPTINIFADGTVAVPGLALASDEPEVPALPSFSTFIALPPGANATVDVLETDIRWHDVASVRPTPRFSAAPGATENPIQLAASRLEPRYELSDKVYRSNALFPADVYRISDPMYLRDVRLVRLQLFPLQYQPVQQRLKQASRLQVSVRFDGADFDNRNPIASTSARPESMAAQILNFDQAAQWHSLPFDDADPATVLPTDQETFRIAVDETGIYELSYEALADAGMPADEVDPQTFEMVYRGEPVSYEFVGNGNGIFEPGEAIRFFGWAFDGSRLERQFLTENVYWLWYDGTAQHIGTQASAPDNPLASQYRESHTREPDLHFTHLWTDQWEDAENEPDAWIWERVFMAVGTGPLTRTHNITLTAPAPDSSTATVTVELLSRHNASLPGHEDHQVSIFVNGDRSYTGHRQWSQAKSVNVTVTVPISLLVDGVNTVHVAYQTPTDRAYEIYYMNRVTVDYNRRFVAEDQQLIFEDPDGLSSYQAGGFASGADEALVWEISDRLHPVAVTGVGVSPGGAPYSYTFGTGNDAATFIVTHAGNTKHPLSIERYVGPDLDPPAGASWLAISHADFMNQAFQLAQHRSQTPFGAFSTHVVDVQDIINQYGYGLPLPHAIQDYLKHALYVWPQAPQYVLLLGDGHINPRQIPCADWNTQCNFWATEPETNYVLTDIVFHDQFVGINASDYTFALLIGDDLIPDVAVGRLAVQTAAEAQNAVDKIIHFEATRLSPERWQQHALFVADNADTAGDFCGQSIAVANMLPGEYVTQTVCLTSSTVTATTEAQTAIFEAVNPPNATTFLNYRGHGAVRGWAGQLINLNEQDPWTPWFNNEPLIILSLDCLDGYFAQPGYEALSEEFLAIEHYGSVAHWSSTGFGYDFQHAPLHYGFYEGLFDYNLTRIGDSINHAKLGYILLAHHRSQLYSFTLQGDPAMEMVKYTSRLYLPSLRR